MAGVNVETIAKAMNVSPRRVQQLADEGMPKVGRGEYDLGQCMAWYIRYLQKAVERRADAGSDDGVLEFTRERSRLAREQADKTALQNAELRGELGRISVWQQEVTRLFGEVRAAMLSMPTKLAPVLDGDTSQRQRKLSESVHEILARLASYRPGSRAKSGKEGTARRGSHSETAAESDGVAMGGSKSPVKQRKLRRARAVAH